MPVYLYIVMMFGFSILFVRDFNIVLIFSSFYINSFSFLFSFSSPFISSSRSRFRERLPIHFRSRFSFVHENNTDDCTFRPKDFFPGFFDPHSPENF